MMPPTKAAANITASGHFSSKKTFHCIRVGEVKFLMTSPYEVGISPLKQIIPNSRFHQSVVTCDVYFTMLIHIPL